MIVNTEKEFWLAAALITATAVFTVVAYIRLVNFGFLYGPYRMNHWVSWIGSIYVAIAVPVFSVLRRRVPHKTKVLLRMHVYGNLTAFLLISIHFASQISRIPIPDLGTGIALYVVMLLLSVTGFLHRFGIKAILTPQNNRFFHISVAVSFYILVGIHILHGVGII